MRYFPLLIIILAVMYGCQRQQPAKYPYTMAGFPAKTQSYLQRIANNGFIGDENYECIDMLDSLLTNDQLLRLSRCEIPLLRSVALSLIKNRPGIDHYSVLMNHLDDTARVCWFFQCATFVWVNVSDYMLINYRWTSTKARDSTLEKVLREHHYLEQAYQKLGEVQQDTTYYAIVRKMAEKPIRMEARSHALYALAAYQKSTDTAFLREVLWQERHQLDENCLALMNAFPLPAYQPILERNIRTLYRRICNDEISIFDNYVKLNFNTIAAYKNPASADLLRKIFYRRPILPCSPKDTATFRSTLYNAIVDNDCPFYADMTQVARPYVLREKSNWLELPALDMDSSFYGEQPVTYGW